MVEVVLSLAAYLNLQLNFNGRFGSKPHLFLKKIYVS